MEQQATVLIVTTVGMNLQPNTHHGKVAVMAGLQMLISQIQIYHGAAGNVGGGISMTVNTKVMKRASVDIGQ